MKTKSKLNQSDVLEVMALDSNKMAAAAALDASVFAPLNVKETMPAKWEDRAQKAWDYYTQEPIVANVVNTWLAFAVGDDIRLSCDDESVQEDGEVAFVRLKLGAWVRDMILQLLVKGDCLGYMRFNQSGDDIEEILCVNPTSVKIKYTDGILEKATQYAEALSGMSSSLDEGISLPVEQVIHRKWNAPAFSQRGNSLVLPAFHSIELLRSYRKAEQAIAKRWTTPMRFIKVGGQFGDKLIMPKQKMLDTVRDKVCQMDMKNGLVVPFYVTAETYGTEGHVLNTEQKVKEIKEDIVVALGLAKSLVTGDGPNYATANVSLRKMLIMVRQIRQSANDFLYWVFNKWLEIKGWQDKQLEFTFTDLNLDEQVEMKKLLLEMYDKGLVSKKTLQIMMDLNPEIEDANRKGERLIDMDWSIQDIVSLVQLGIMSVATAQELLGLDKAQEEKNTETDAALDIGRLYSRTQKVHTEKMCDDCSFFDEDHNRCQCQESETTFDTPACVLFEPKLQNLAEREASRHTTSTMLSAETGSPDDGKPGTGGCGCPNQ